MGRVQDKVAIITGASSGVGKEDAILLAREGAKVVLTDLNEVEGVKVADKINATTPGSALFIKHDIASEDGWKEVIAKTETTFGGLDILVNNAAILIYGNIENTNLADWQKIQRINSDGYFLGCHYAIPAMKKRGGGSIVNMSSMAGIGGVGSFCAYSASKGAVAAMTRSIAAHNRMTLNKIRCNSIHPDGIATPMVTGLHAAMPKGQNTAVRMMDPKQMQARFAQPQDIANLVLFLASDESKFINGAEMRIDNGYLMWAD
jgi:3(or 17)beta-hydroxysteroid dehydrogenase